MAEDIKIVGTMTKSVKIPSTVAAPQSNTKNALKAAKPKTEEISLLKIQLSNLAKQNLNRRVNNAQAVNQTLSLAVTSKYPASKSVDMDNFDVLNQGVHGSCVTFANTAAINAALNKNDYVSQLCSLQLGNHLEQHGYNASGWDGTWGRAVLSQIDAFGVVSKAQEAAHGCGGLTAYPVRDERPTTSMSVEDYHQISENISSSVLWSPVLDVYKALSERVDTNKTLDEVKASLLAGDRLTFGVLLADFDLGFVGAVGKNKASDNSVSYDSWVLTPEIARDVYLRPNFGGHEMIITGYDDDAVATDEQGNEHRGLLTLRNSWGNSVGNKGNFYMSYDYFKLLVIEVQRIRAMQN